MRRALMWLNLYGCEAVRRKDKNTLKMHFLCLTDAPWNETDFFLLWIISPTIWSLFGLNFSKLNWGKGESINLLQNRFTSSILHTRFKQASLNILRNFTGNRSCCGGENSICKLCHSHELMPGRTVRRHQTTQGCRNLGAWGGDSTPHILADQLT